MAILRLLAWVLLVVSGASPASSVDLKALRFGDLVASSEAVCRFHLGSVQEKLGPGDVASHLESGFILSKGLRGNCPPDVSITWSFQDLSLDQVGSEWILFLTKKSGKEPWQIASSPHGAWKIETLQVVDWSKTTVEIVSPGRFSNILDIPDQVFYTAIFHRQYFENLGIDFTARVIRAESLGAWLLRLNK